MSDIALDRAITDLICSLESFTEGQSRPVGAFYASGRRLDYDTKYDVLRELETVRELIDGAA